jgi:hypothetical protein
MLLTNWLPASYRSPFRYSLRLTSFWLVAVELCCKPKEEMYMFFLRGSTKFRARGGPKLLSMRLNLNGHFPLDSHRSEYLCFDRSYILPRSELPYIVCLTKEHPNSGQGSYKCQRGPQPDHMGQTLMCLTTPSWKELPRTGLSHLHFTVQKHRIRQHDQFMQSHIAVSCQS